MIDTAAFIAENAANFERVEQQYGTTFTETQKQDVAIYADVLRNFDDAALFAMRCYVYVDEVDTAVSSNTSDFIEVRTTEGHPISKMVDGKLETGFRVEPGSTISYYAEKSAEWLADAPGIWRVSEVDHYSITDFDLLARNVSLKLGISDESARTALDRYIRQMEIVESRTIDRDAICNEDAAFLLETVKMGQSHGELGKEQLIAVTATMRDYNEAERQWKAATEMRDQSIRDAIGAGVRLKDISGVTGLSRARIYQICSD